MKVVDYAIHHQSVAYLERRTATYRSLTKKINEKEMDEPIDIFQSSLNHDKNIVRFCDHLSPVYFLSVHAFQRCIIIVVSYL